MKPASKAQSLARRQLKTLAKIFDNFGGILGFASGGVIETPIKPTPTTSDKGCPQHINPAKPQVTVNINVGDCDPKTADHLKEWLDKRFRKDTNNDQ
jgi:hypothetical protein